MEISVPSHIVIKNSAAFQTILMDVAYDFVTARDLSEQIIQQALTEGRTWHLEIKGQCELGAGEPGGIRRGLWPYVEDDAYSPRELLIVSAGIFPNVLRLSDTYIRAHKSMSGFTKGRNYEVVWEYSTKSTLNLYVELAELTSTSQGCSRRWPAQKINLLEFLRPEYRDCFEFH